MSTTADGHHQTAGDDQIGIFHAAAVMVGVSLVLVSGRLYSHLRLVKSNTLLDDSFIILSWILALCAIIAAYRIQHATVELLATDRPTIPNVETFFNRVWAFIWLYNAGLAMTKFSVLFQYRRIFAVPEFQMVNNILLILMIPYALWTTLASIISCWPISYFWRRVDPTAGMGRCLDASDYFLSNSVMNIISDVIILVLPLPALASLRKIPIRQKVGLFVLFTLGGTFLMIISVLRLIIFRSADLANVLDFAWRYVPLVVWSSVEMSVGIICSSLPAMKPLVVKAFPALASTGSAGSDGQETAAFVGPSRGASKLLGKQGDGMNLQSIELVVTEGRDRETP